MQVFTIFVGYININLLTYSLLKKYFHTFAIYGKIPTSLVKYTFFIGREICSSHKSVN
uniref:Uncharacterized protein n=1 Tax=Lepeophtheirus salmonis TaxID=72036 RepID=A0A0K2UB04_LEPSM